MTSQHWQCINLLHQSCARTQLQDHSSTGIYCESPLQTLRESPAFGCAPPCSSQDHTQPASLKLSSVFHLRHHERSTSSGPAVPSTHSWPLIFSQESRQGVSTALRTALVSKVSKVCRDAQLWQKKHRDICSSARSWLPAVLPSDQGKNSQILHAMWSAATGEAASFSPTKVFSVWKMRSS